jgi:hypothetical protein
VAIQAQPFQCVVERRRNAFYVRYLPAEEGAPEDPTTPRDFDYQYGLSDAEGLIPPADSRTIEARFRFQAADAPAVTFRTLLPRVDLRRQTGSETGRTAPG